MLDGYNGCLRGMLDGCEMLDGFLMEIESCAGPEGGSRSWPQNVTTLAPRLMRAPSVADGSARIDGRSDVRVTF